MTDRKDDGCLRPRALEWVGRHLDPGEHVVDTGVLYGGLTAEMRWLTVAGPDGGSRRLVLRTFTHPEFVADAERLLAGEAAALAVLTGTGVPAPRPVAVDAHAAHCEYPSLLMTHLPGRTLLADDGIEERVVPLARQLVAIHRLRPAARPAGYQPWTTAEEVVPPPGADAAAWSAAVEVIRAPAPAYEGRYLHRDFHPCNVLFEPGPEGAREPRITGVVDWVQTSWGPADLDVAHCSSNLAMLHGPAWAGRFAREYERAGGVLAATAGERRYWRLLDALAFSEAATWVVRAWREAGREDLTVHAVEQRLDAYVTGLMDAAD
ncbi:Ser/Thr protein kinase RdoA involved in Cpx stress response, MazF antagonist [Actinacidiphila yanglinensis]|uniref:Ser/Thr protein kinase RdoA involved in Cpx stress response, MazF antagonist n=1 Tax=Actinacidiphila yanglinensis TaxID=310779 RepID=A0A1H6E3W3_9ACTN|nr:aminoglycoside phosphotransferase family protein [Actinacidiphila yanglinensis]SEG91585.1 Ser/Thr protein kinase RdoA involved in Cpx stress response, MazF antagonist [Actinacidiphila yanglinensis]